VKTSDDREKMRSHFRGINSKLWDDTHQLRSVSLLLRMASSQWTLPSLRRGNERNRYMSCQRMLGSTFDGNSGKIMRLRNES
jgi:hypothetical protein